MSFYKLISEVATVSAEKNFKRQFRKLLFRVKADGSYRKRRMCVALSEKAIFFFFLKQVDCGDIPLRTMCSELC